MSTTSVPLEIEKKFTLNYKTTAFYLLIILVSFGIGIDVGRQNIMQDVSKIWRTHAGECVQDISSSCMLDSYTTMVHELRILTDGF